MYPNQYRLLLANLGFCPDVQGKTIFAELDVGVGLQGQKTQTSFRDPENFDGVIREMVLH
jgi:hypothetical protein